MMSLIGRWILDWLIGWGGLSLLVAIAAGAVWWFIPAIFTKVRAIAFNVAIGAFAANFIFTTGFTNGAASTKAEWDAAVISEGVRGTSDREQAEAEIPPAPPDLPAQACPAGDATPAPTLDRRLLNDRNNRSRNR